MFEVASGKHGALRIDDRSDGGCCTPGPSTNN